MTDEQKTLPRTEPGVEGRAKTDIWDTVRGALAGVLLILVFLATLQLYFAVQEFIRTWFADEYVPIFNAVFFLCVIGGSLFAIRRYFASR
jgi:hypothetical protein